MGNEAHQSCMHSVVYLYALCMAVSGVIPKPIMKPADDQFLLVGSSIQMNCTLNVDGTGQDENNNAYNVHNLTIKLPHSNDLDRATLIYDEESLTLEVSIMYASLNDSGIYCCVYNNTWSSKGIINVNVKELPELPSNLTCISHDFYDLNCSAVLPVQSRYVPMNWSMQFKKGSSGILPVNCFRIESEVTTEFCGLKAEDFEPFATFNITVIGINNDFKINLSKSFVVEASTAIVKPNPVDSFEYFLTNDSTSVLLKWNRKWYEILNCRLESRLEIISENNRTLERHFYKPDTISSDYCYTLKDLVPFTNYSATVYIKPEDAIGEVYWSDGTKLNFVTPDDVPGRPPTMTAASFLTFNCSELFCVVLYWKNPPKQYLHGVISYTVEIRTLTLSSHQETTSENISSYRSCYKLKQMLSKNASYDIEMKIMTKKGYNANSAGVMVRNLETDEAHKIKCVAVEIHNNQVSVSWMVDVKLCETICTVTYYWCSANKSDVYFECQDDVNWFTVTVTNGSKIPTQQSLNQSNDSNIEYAVSLAIGNESSGMVWGCVRYQNCNTECKQKSVDELHYLSPEPSNLSVILGVTLPTCILLFFLVALYFICHRMQQHISDVEKINVPIDTQTVYSMKEENIDKDEEEDVPKDQDMDSGKMSSPHSSVNSSTRLITDQHGNVINTRTVMVISRDNISGLDDWVQNSSSACLSGYMKHVDENVKSVTSIADDIVDDKDNVSCLSDAYGTGSTSSSIAAQTRVLENTHGVKNTFESNNNINNGKNIPNKNMNIHNCLSSAIQERYDASDRFNGGNQKHSTVGASDGRVTVTRLNAHGIVTTNEDYIRVTNNGDTVGVNDNPISSLYATNHRTFTMDDSKKTLLNTSFDINHLRASRQSIPSRVKASNSPELSDCSTTAYKMDSAEEFGLIEGYRDAEYFNKVVSFSSYS